MTMVCWCHGDPSCPDSEGRQTSCEERIGRKMGYLVNGRVAHLIEGTLYAFCGVSPTVSSEWYGTGSQDEYERAAMLPLCKRCARHWGLSR